MNTNIGHFPGGGGNGSNGGYGGNGPIGIAVVAFVVAASKIPKIALKICFKSNKNYLKGFNFSLANCTYKC